MAFAGVAPLVGGVVVSLLDRTWSAQAARLSIIWTGCLLAFLGGVRRGLTFSETGGGRWTELATMIAFYSVGVVSISLQSAAAAAVGCVCVAVLDALAARRGEVPGYFIWLRPLQFGLSAIALAALALRGSAGT